MSKRVHNAEAADVVDLHVAMGMACLLGLLVFAVAWVWTHGSRVAYCVGPAMFAAVFLSAILGAGIPLLFRSLRIDPAIASSVFLTTITDVVGFFVFLGLAALILL